MSESAPSLPEGPTEPAAVFEPPHLAPAAPVVRRGRGRPKGSGKKNPTPREHSERNPGLQPGEAPNSAGALPRPGEKSKLVKSPEHLALILAKTSVRAVMLTAGSEGALGKAMPVALALGWHDEEALARGAGALPAERTREAVKLMWPLLEEAGAFDFELSKEAAFCMGAVILLGPALVPIAQLAKEAMFGHLKKKPVPPPAAPADKGESFAVYRGDAGETLPEKRAAPPA